ncbi:hypothetical protein L3081_16625 [Colwellia sp. MSW7]|uniref:Uncharacterized protein n=1 Tax=Colwellia maritima TaxID=2912588 RepID=A0ABS9X3A9_9GAMM|nr:hypothetical protein [Colwellia maritima]MCI2284713.1 hypothetical protein [Colwellia maritima]
MKKLVFIIIALISMLPSTSNATLITPSAITSTGGFNNDVALINDGIIRLNQAYGVLIQTFGGIVHSRQHLRWILASYII